MLARERQNKIVEMVNINGSVLVKELSELFDVTEDSIRKDLSLLEKKGLLKKTYGGAVKNRINTHELYVSQRKGKNVKEKQEVAKHAFDLIREGDMIFLDISTSNIELINLIIAANLKITVVTNMIDVMLSFVAPAVTNFVFIGGKLNRGRDGFIGSYTNKQLEEFNFDMAFMGAVGIDVDNNKVYTYATDDAITKETIMNSSNKCYVVVENGKFSRLGNYKYATISDFDGIVTDEEPEKEIAAKIKKYDVKLIY